MMPAPRPTKTGTPDKHAVTAAPRKSLRRRLVLAFGTLLTLSMLGGAVVLGGGFLWFVQHVPAQEVVLERDADGIVVLTGGTSRIADAIALLADGHGRRLLISGVNPSTSPREIARLVPRQERLVECCVDLDYAAVNTVGNAAGARRWVRDHGFRSVIVVTSSYHMPRSMAELAHQLPGIELIPFPVVSDRLRAESWWTSPPTVRLLITEYLKYMVAHVRMRLEPAPEMTDVARARGQTRS